MLQLRAEVAALRAERTAAVGGDVSLSQTYEPFCRPCRTSCHFSTRVSQSVDIGAADLRALKQVAEHYSPSTMLRRVQGRARRQPRSSRRRGRRRPSPSGSSISRWISTLSSAHRWASSWPCARCCDNEDNEAEQITKLC